MHLWRRPAVSQTLDATTGLVVDTTDRWAGPPDSVDGSWKVTWPHSKPQLVKFRVAAVGGWPRVASEFSEPSDPVAAGGPAWRSLAQAAGWGRVWPLAALPVPPSRHSPCVRGAWPAPAADLFALPAVRRCARQARHCQQRHERGHGLAHAGLEGRADSNQVRAFATPFCLSVCLACFARMLRRRRGSCYAAHRCSQHGQPRLSAGVLAADSAARVLLLPTLLLPTLRYRVRVRELVSSTGGLELVTEVEIEAPATAATIDMTATGNGVYWATVEASNGAVWGRPSNGAGPLLVGVPPAVGAPAAASGNGELIITVQPLASEHPAATEYFAKVRSIGAVLTKLPGE